MRWRWTWRTVYVGRAVGEETTKGMGVLAKALAGLRLGLLAVVLVTTLVTTCVAGPVGVYLALAAAIASLIFCFDPPMLAAAMRDWGVRCFIASFFILWAAFIITAKTPNDMMAFVDFLAFPVVIPLYALFARHAGSRSVAIVSILAGIGCAVALGVGLFEVRILGKGRAEGGTSAIFFSDMAALLSFFSLWGLVTLKTPWRWLLLAVFAFGIGAAVLGGTRGSMIAAAALLVGFLAYVTVSPRLPLASKWATVFAVLSGSTVFLFITFDMSRMLSIFDTAAEVATSGISSDLSANYRLMLYSAGWQSFIDAPIFGHGWWDRFMAAYPYLPRGPFDVWIGDRTAHLHNDILTFASGAGMTGVLAYLILMAAPLVSAIRSARTERRALRICAALGLSLGYTAMGLTDTMFVFEIPKSIFVLSAAIVMAFYLDAPPIKQAA